MVVARGGLARPGLGQVGGSSLPLQKNMAVQLDTRGLRLYGQLPMSVHSIVPLCIGDRLLAGLCLPSRSFT